MSSVGKVQITGLREFQRALKAMDTDLPRQLRLVLNQASKLVIDYAEPRFPHKTGRAAASLKAKSSQREARVSLGGRRAPWAPWVDFGGQGKVRGRPPHREFIRGGRYVYKGLEVRRAEITEVMAAGMTELARTAGLEVT
jgi:hypothetical protein